MNQIAALIKEGENHFGSGGRNTPQFNAFFRLFKKHFTKELTELGCKEMNFSKGHFYLSGFFTSNTGQIYYFSIPDVRHFNDTKLMYRTAKDYKDYTGGMNQYCLIKDGMNQQMRIN